MQLDGKIAIITGASSGIGKASATLFAGEGARLVLAARRGGQLEAVADEIRTGGGEAVFLPGDVRDADYAQALVALAERQFGGLDIALNNAGTLGEMGPVEQMTPANWDFVLQTNLTSAFLVAKHQIPALRKRGGGSLVFTSSFVGPELGMPGMAAYAAAKAGLVGLARCIAVEHGAENIRANALLPGGTDTPMGKDFGDTPEALAFVRAMHALKRMAQPGEIARAALFLASDASSFVTGSAFLADGGNSICKT